MELTIERVDMGGQGDVINQLVMQLREDGWRILYYCIPNTPHLNVVPITVKNGASKQRYPDIVAFRSEYMRFLEVEIQLTKQVVTDILERFDEFISTLRSNDSWGLWRDHVTKQTGIVLPVSFNPICDLVICHELTRSHEPMIAELRKKGIVVSTLSTIVF